MARIHFLASTLAALFLSFANAHEHSYTIPSAVQPGTATAQLSLASAAKPLDAPKVSRITNSSYDWWYFDVASTHPQDRSTVVVTFFTSTENAFPLLDPLETVAPVYIWGTYANGTRWEGIANATGATVTVDGEKSTGEWHGTGFSWRATSARQYEITVDSPELGVKGTISFNSIAPAHLPCGRVKSGETLQVGPHIGWANMIPDAASVVDLYVDGTHVKFHGTGYHDKNWGDIPFPVNVASWYWGHGRVGPYSLVWFDLLDRDGKEHLSAYLAKDDKIVSASCKSTSIKVRPVPLAGAYPPVLATPNPVGYHIDLEGEVKMQLDVHVIAALVKPNPAYARFFGNVTAVSTGGKRYEGTALFEQFKLTQ